jgi:hypothetical protein
MKTNLTWSRKLLLALLPVVLLSIAAEPVQADDTNPYTSGCAATSRPIYTRWTGTGVVTLKFSFGCLTAWAEFTCRSGNGCTNFTLWAARNDGASSTVWVTWPASVPNGFTIYTGQLFDGSWFTTRACYQGYFLQPQYCTWAY